MPDTHMEPRDALIVGSILRLIEAGADPLITYEIAETVLPARGFPMTPALVRGLIVQTWTLSGRNVAPASRFIEAAEAYIRPRIDRPNRKVAAAATARRAKRERAA